MLSKMKFPLFKMRAFEEITTNGFGHIVVVTNNNKWVLDDPSIDEPDYFRRRIIMKSRKYELYPLYEKVDNISQLMKYKSGTYFIDRSGKYFKYKKGNKYYNLNYWKIKKRLYDPNRGSMVFVKGLPMPFYFATRVPFNYKYLGLLNVDGGFLVYDLSEEKKDDTRRKL